MRDDKNTSEAIVKFSAFIQCFLAWGKEQLPI